MTQEQEAELRRVARDLPFEIPGNPEHLVFYHHRKADGTMVSFSCYVVEQVAVRLGTTTEDVIERLGN